MQIDHGRDQRLWLKEGIHERQLVMKGENRAMRL